MKLLIKMKTNTSKKVEKIITIENMKYQERVLFLKIIIFKYNQNS